MEVSFSTRKMQKACSSEKEAGKTWGERRARVVLQRIAELRAADTLEDMSLWPSARCHPLVGNRKGQFVVEAVHPFGVVFEPDHDPTPTKPDGGLDRRLVTKVLVLGVENYHPY